MRALFTFGFGFLASCSAALGQIPANGADQALESLTGWWRYDSNEWGCDDTDGQYRAALGRYAIDELQQLQPAGGNLRLGFYDGECSFHDARLSGDGITMYAMCVAEGEDFQGAATLKPISSTAIAVETPVINATLVACNVAQVSHIEAVAGLIATSSNHDTVAAPVVAVGLVEPLQPPPQRTAPFSAPSFDTAVFDPQRNTISRVYDDYCEPGFADANNWGDGRWDAGRYESYTRQLLVRYGGNCEEFFVDELVAFTTLDDLVIARPDLGFPEGQPTLPPAQAFVLGAFVRMVEADRQYGCTGEAIDPSFRAAATPLVEKATLGDLVSMSKGYAVSLALESPYAHLGDEVQCQIRPVQFQSIATVMVTSGFYEMYVYPQAARR